jgi:hypothetical protein
MPTGFFCLNRFYLRVDHTLVRVYDTRLYHEAGTNFILREYLKRESKTSDINVSSFFQSLLLSLLVLLLLIELKIIKVKYLP